MKNSKILASTLVIIASCLSLLFLSFSTLLLCLTLLLITFTKHKLIPIKKEFTWYSFAVLSSALVEIIFVNFGNAWSYTNKEFFGIPLWIPLFWGILATTMINSYDSLTAN